MTVSPSTIFPNLCLAWMDPSNGQHQAMNTHSLEDVLACPKSQQETRPRPQPEQSLRCPRCDSTNTKFCYYNNYSLTQPRYFCKACRRYWTKGGSLRNVPVGGGCRKNKRSSSSKRTQDQQHPSNNSNPFPLFSPLNYDSNDLSLSFGGLPKEPTRQLGFHDHDTPILGNFNNTHCDIFGNPNRTTTSTTPGFLNSLRSGFLDVPSGFHNFTYGFGNQNMGEVESSGGEEVVLPYEEMRGAATTTATAIPPKQEFNNNGKDGENRMFWNFPWQYGGEGSMGGVDSGRECWNGLGSSWHGLVNSPLI